MVLQYPDCLFPWCMRLLTVNIETIFIPCNSCHSVVLNYSAIHKHRGKHPSPLTTLIPTAQISSPSTSYETTPIPQGRGRIHQRARRQSLLCPCRKLPDGCLRRNA